MKFRHGDLLLTAVEELPDHEALRLTNKGNLVILEGETTGHAHRLSGGEVLIAEGPDKVLDALTVTENAVFEEGSRRFTMFVRIDEQPADLTHEEHRTIQIPPGIYQVSRQRQYVPQQRPSFVLD